MPGLGQVDGVALALSKEYTKLTPLLGKGSAIKRLTMDMEATQKRQMEFDKHMSIIQSVGDKYVLRIFTSHMESKVRFLFVCFGFKITRCFLITFSRFPLRILLKLVS